MPTVSIVRDELFELLGQKYSEEEFDELCFEFGLELDGVVTEKPKLGSRALTAASVDLSDQIVYKIEVPANRYDLLCVEGLSQALRIFTNKDPSIPQYKLTQPRISMAVDTHSVNGVRPFVVCAVLNDLKMNDQVYKSLIDLQDKLHHNICRKRTLVAIGTHDLDKLDHKNGHLTYTAEIPEEIRFVPLAKHSECDGNELMATYENDNQLKKYLHIIKDSSRYPVIRDASKNVLSLPPIINGDMSKVTLDTKNLFIECTATDLTKANIVLNILVSTFSKYCTTPYQVEPVSIIYNNEKTIITPDFTSPIVEADVDFIHKGIGVFDISTEDMVNYLRRMQLPATITNDNHTISVNVPIIRSDILHACDIMCDIAIAYGFNKVPEQKVITPTVGKQQPLNHLSDLIRREGFSQQAYTEVLTWVTVSDAENFSLLRRKNSDLAVKIGNPKTLEFEQCRVSLLTGLLKTLRENRKCKVPIRLFEVGDVVLKDKFSETGAINRRKAAAIYCSTVAGFEVIQGLLECVMKVLGVKRCVGGKGKGEWDIDDKGCEDDVYMKGIINYNMKGIIKFKIF